MDEGEGTGLTATTVVAGGFFLRLLRLFRIEVMLLPFVVSQRVAAAKDRIAAGTFQRFVTVHVAFSIKNTPH